MENLKTQQPIAITMGEPSGISAEIIFKSWKLRKQKNLFPFFVYDCFNRLNNISQKYNFNIPLKVISSEKETFDYFDNFLPIININDNVQANLGTPNYRNSKFVIQSIDIAVKAACEKKIKAIVTSPVCKKMLIKNGFSFAGQTEYISHIVSKIKKKKFTEIMILSTTEPCDKQKNLIVGLVTTHLPLRKVNSTLSCDLIVNKTLSFNNSLKDYWKINSPNIAICGLNPHSGESGFLGKEEEKIITPAIKILKRKKIKVEGPISSDTCFSGYIRKKFDGIICHYHDQALIPVKTLDFFKSINFTGGLPILRVSPDHGPAFDIAKKRTADPNSMISAIQAASNFGIL